MSMDWLGKVVVTRYGDGSTKCAVEVASYCDAPTIGGRDEYGIWVNWRADLSREATAEETIAYWKERALKAEGERPVVQRPHRIEVRRTPKVETGEAAT
jgi:hypothetical protein